MNILHMKYALEVARLGSLNKAAETLLIAQPNISRSIKELEADLGISIFNRSAKGMVLTPQGEEFIEHAKDILKRIDDVEMLYKSGTKKKQRFSASVSGACYISEAFAHFFKELEEHSTEIIYRETDARSTINNVLNNDYKLGIIHYAKNFDKQFKAALEEKGLCCELVAEYSYLLVMNRESPLAQKENISVHDLASFTEIAYVEPYVPSLPHSRVVREELPDHIDRRIFVFERAGRLELLSEDPCTYMWASPISEKMLKRYDLVQRRCADNKRVYRDMLIYRKGYKLSESDEQFVALLADSKRKCL